MLIGFLYAGVVNHHTAFLNFVRDLIGDLLNISAVILITTHAHIKRIEILRFMSTNDVPIPQAKKPYSLSRSIFPVSGHYFFTSLARGCLRRLGRGQGY